MTRYIIIGSGAAGVSAAETIRELDPSGDITICTAEKDGYYSRPALAYYLSREITRKSLFPKTRADFDKQSISVLHKKIIAIDPVHKHVLADDQGKIPYDKLLLATGAAAVKPGVEGGDLENVVYLDSLGQTERMIKTGRKARKAIVVGGGITALEIVEGLLSRKLEVHFLLRGQHYWNRVLDPIESELILRRLEHEGVSIHRNSSLAAILGKRGRVSGVQMDDGTVIKAGMVAFAIGVRPRPDLLDTAGMQSQRGAVVNARLETSLPDIYAAGDVAEVYDPAAESWVIDCLWPIARQQGIAAGKNMAGIPTAYLRRTPMNVTRLSGLTTTIIGQVGSAADTPEFSIVRGESESWQLQPDAIICQNEFDINRVRLMVGVDRILGAVLMGDQTLSPILENIVANNICIEEIRDELTTPNANLADVLIRFDRKRRET